MKQVTLIIGPNNQFIGIVELEKKAKAMASLYENTDIGEGAITCITFNLNELKPMQKVHLYTKAETLEG